jgi:Ca2+-transporting ATPase
MTNSQIEGLTSEQAKTLQATFGRNELTPQKKTSFIRKVLHIIAEPMFLLLLIAAVIYFVLGEPRDGAIMLIFVLGVISIDVIQEWKTDRTLSALKELFSPRVQVIRDGVEQSIASVDLVPGDVILLCEGVKIPADGIVLRCNDLCVDESSLTGEAEGVWKCQADGCAPSSDYWRKDYCYAGTLITLGTAAVLVEKTGVQTEYGKIGANVASAPEEDTPLQKQTGRLVKICAGIAAVLFALVGAFTFINIPDHMPGARFVESVLSGITLAMAMIPEEFPVILTVFLSMGAWRLAKKNSLVRRLPSVETLGAVSVLCVDKTGTITMNQMTVQETWAPNHDDHILCETMGLGCETDAYDPMEKAMLRYCDNMGISKEHLFSGELVSEYAFTNELKMMGHVWRRDGKLIIAAKGSPERLLPLCIMTPEEREAADHMLVKMGKEGLRVIAVGRMMPANESEIPARLTDCRLTFCGLIGLADPPRESVARDIATCNQAGVRVVMITGDNGITASSIARKIGMQDTDNIITADELERMTDDELREKVKTVSIFSRVIPEHKMRIVKAFRDNGAIVAMTGDGVNDAPALKYADIGIAMGKRGSEVSREAADLILMDDNFSTIVDTIKDGRRIYDNIRKAVGYVFTIHIPIALSSLLAPILGIAPVSLFLLPLHVVLLELIIDPTCSIVLERQPAEEDIMNRPPRDPKEQMLTRKGLVKSVLQGLAMFVSAFGIYYWTILHQPADALLARTMGLSVLILSNLLLVLVNSSDHDSILHSVRRLAKDRVMWIVNIGVLAGLAAILYTPISSVLKLAPLSAIQLLTVVGLAIVSTCWFEIVKAIRRSRMKVEL